MQSVLITGAAGFIGSAVTKKFLDKNYKVIGIDNLNNYYDKNLKLARLKDISSLNFNNTSLWNFEEIGLQDKTSLANLFKDYTPDIVVNLAAQAGVRFSLKKPSKYLESNIVGFGNLLENCKQFKIKNLIYASSSSVYGASKDLPFRETNSVNHPLSIYAATKKSNEMMAHVYSNLYSIPCTGLRFFTVYGPWGRPDMAPMIFTKKIINGEPIDIFNNGNMERDFTYIEDIVEGIFRCSLKPALSNADFNLKTSDSSTSFCPHRIFNIGNGKPIKLIKFIEILEEQIGIKAIKRFKSMQPGDVVATSSDNAKLKAWIGYSPNTSLESGITKFLKWYFDYYQINKPFYE